MHFSYNHLPLSSCAALYGVFAAVVRSKALVASDAQY